MNIQEASITKEKEALIEDFFKPEAKRYIFGINKYGDKLFDEFKNKNLKVEAFIDDFTPNKIHKNTKIIKLQSIEEGYVVVVVTCNTKEAIEKIKKENVKRGGKIKFIDYFAFQKHSKLDLVELEFCDNFINPKPSNFSHFRDDFSKNRNEYENIYNSLADEESKKYFENIINFRLTQDYKYMESFHSKLKEQYFEDFLDIKNIDYFFDIGAYRGETSKEFISRNRNYKNIYVFEPDSNNILEARKNLKEYKNIEFFNIAIGDKKKIMYLKDNKDKTALHLLDSNEDNTTKIQLDSIDNVIENIEQKSEMEGGGNMILKMDIESAERIAIKGAKNTILNFHPKMAICVYHQFDDFYQIPKLILNIRKDYKIYFRHYSSGIMESVMFFIPKIEKEKN